MTSGPIAVDLAASNETEELVAGDAERIALWPRNRAGLVAAAVLGHMTFNMAMPFLPLYVGDLGVTDREEAVLWAGVILGTAPFTSALSAPIWGVLGDRFGMKIMLQRCLVACFVLFLGMGAAQNVFQLFLLRLVFGLVGGFGPVILSLAAANAPRRRVSESIGFVQGVQLMSIAIGPAIGGPVADLVGMRQTFLVTAPLYLVGLGLVTYLLSEVRTEGAPSPALTARPATSNRLQAALEVLARVRRTPAAAWVAMLTLVLFLSQLAERTMGPVLPLFVADLGTPANTVASVSGVLIAIGGVAAASSANLFGRAVRRFGASRLLLGGATGGAVFCVLLAQSSSLPELIVERVGMALLIGGAATICYGAATLTGGNRIGTVTGLLSSGTYFANGLGPLFAGVVGQAGLRAVFVFDAATLVLTAVLVAVVLRPLSATVAETP